MCIESYAYADAMCSERCEQSMGVGCCRAAPISLASCLHRGSSLRHKLHAEEHGNDDLFWIRTLCRQGQLEQAVNMLCRMDTPPSSDVDIYVFLLKACNHLSALSQAQQIHAHLARHRVSLSGFLGDYLAMTLARCGAAEDASELFLHLCRPTVYSWTALISAYTDCGQAEEALGLYECMLDDGVEPDSYTFVCLFKACGTTLDLVHGKKLHLDARKQGLAEDVFVGNTLISMYGKCRAFQEAEDVFRELSKRNIVSWCAMLSMYVEQGQGAGALRLYRQMLEESVNPDRLAAMLAIQACGVLAEDEEPSQIEGWCSEDSLLLCIGEAIHADACRKGFASDTFFNSALVSMYGKAASVTEAEHAFQAVPQRNIVSWNAMLSAYIGQGRGDRALWLYKHMHQEGVSPDQLSFVFSLQACAILTTTEEFSTDRGSSKIMCLEVGQALHSDACKRGVAFDAVLGSALVSMYGKCGAVSEMEVVFTSLSEHNIVSWNAMLTTYVEQGQGIRALALYRQLQEENICPDELSSTYALQACATVLENEVAHNLEEQSNKIMALEIGSSLHADARRSGWAAGLFAGNALLKLYAKYGAVAEAEHVFDDLSQPNLVSWNVMLRAYVDQSQAEKALQLFGQMQKVDLSYDCTTVISVLQACSAMGHVELCKHLHFHMVSIGYDQIPSAAATAIHAYGCCASMADAQACFDELWDPHVASWNACISGHAGEASHMASLQCFETLRLVGMTPNEVTFTLLLSACSHAGLLEEALEYFKSISMDYELAADAKHKSIVLDLLGRIGDFRRIDDMFGRMQVQADLSTLLCLLGACRVHGNLKLATLIFDHAVEFYPREAPVYVLMSNIYADFGMRELAVKVGHLASKQECRSLYNS